MRKVILSMMVAYMDEETEAYMYNVLNSVDGILLGRVSYELILLKQPLVRRLNTT